MNTFCRLGNAAPYVLVFASFVVSLSALDAEEPSFQQSSKLFEDYSTKGHQKAKGVDMRVGYPKGWRAEEGDRPNVVQKFISPKGYGDGSLVVTIHNLPDAVTATEIKSMFVGEGPSDILPDGAKQLSRQHTKIEQIDADIITSITRTERAGMRLAMFSHTLVFCVERKMVVINMSCGARDGEVSDSDLIKRGNQQSALFTLCINRIVLAAAWNK